MPGATRNAAAWRRYIRRRLPNYHGAGLSGSPGATLKTKIMTITVGSLFSGVGMIDYGLERLCGGFEIAYQVEIENYLVKVLERHWPDTLRFRDVRECGSHNLPYADCIVGGPPCQPASCAGKRKGPEDERWLWGETLRIIGEMEPRYCILENPTGLLTLNDGREFGRILGTLAALGYGVEWHCIPASAVGAPHIRDRVWIVAYSNSQRQQDSARGNDPNRNNTRRKEEANRPRSRGPRERGLPNPESESPGRLPVRATPQQPRPEFGCSDLSNSNSQRRPQQRSGESAAEELRCSERGSNLEDTTGRRKRFNLQSGGEEGAQSEPVQSGERQTQSWLGRETDGTTGRVDGIITRYPTDSGAWPGKRPICEISEWEGEVPRTITERIPNRNARLKALGNGAVPQVVAFLGAELLRYHQERNG